MQLESYAMGVANMVKRITAFIFIFLFCTLLGDTNPDFLQNHCTYTGESPSWSAVFTADEKGGFTTNEHGLTFFSRSKDLLTITYKKDPAGLDSVKQIRIDYKPEPGYFSGSLSEDYTNGPGAQKIYRIRTGSSQGAMLLKEDMVLTVSVTMDGTAETMYLKNPAIN